MLMIFSVETWGQWHVSSIWIETTVCRAGDSTAISSVQDPEKELIPAPACGMSSFWGDIPISYQSLVGAGVGCPSHWGDMQCRGEQPLPVPNAIKPRGGCFSKSLMGDVQTFSNWVLLWNKIPFKNQCSSVGGSSLSPLSQWLRHGAELQALQQLGNDCQHSTFTGGQNLV